MLDADTKKKIDSLRNILVGKIPNPQSQVEQITTGLIYKFMYDMDQESIEMGGEGSFFVGDYEKYSWDNLFDTKLSGVDKVSLYSSAIEGMYLNPNAPELFRNIFRNAFLPFKDPSTLNMFLKEINEFHYSHSEKLGDAFEYLISIMGSQGDAGQFRTPRHIIDFIVEIINPQKHETVLDPACGTAGFLISSYKHILKTNTDKKLGDLLSASDRKKVGENIGGYDISPEMIKLSLVNMYLHGFSTPDIEEYDTLSSEDKWNEYYDVILANPPFFSPTGGIQPHQRFGVQSTKAEILFTSYILEHLKPNGRAGIIVPEGIIFETRTKAYVELRKQLIENALVGVISLPAGVFQPYSGVKTSILILDKKLSKERDSIFFTEVKNDGFSLGSQRKPINENDIPNMIEEITKFLTSSESHNLNVLNKNELLEKDYSLTYSKYSKIDHYQESKYEIVPLGNLVEIFSGSRDKGGKKSEGIPSIGGGQISKDGNIIKDKMVFISEEHFKKIKKGKLEDGDVLIVKDGATTGKIGIYRGEFEHAAINEHVFALRGDPSKILNFYLLYLLKTTKFKDILQPYIQGIIGGINLDIKEIKIPLPTLEVQQEIVDELEGYQKIIDGCKQVAKNYKPTIDIDSSWEFIELGEMAKTQYGTSNKSLDIGKIPVLRMGNLQNGEIEYDDLVFSDNEEDIEKYSLDEGDILFNRTNSPALVGKTSIFRGYKSAIIFAGYLVRVKASQEKILPEYLNAILNSTYGEMLNAKNVSISGNQANINASKLAAYPIPLAPLDVQEKIIEGIEEERKVIEGNKKLIEIYTQKIQNRINKVWGE